MSRLQEAANELATVYDDYFELSKELQTDLDKILDDESDSPSWQRNFVRTAWPMIEAYSGTLRNLCSVLDKHSEFKKTKRQQHLLNGTAKFSSDQRIKESLKLAFRIHELDEKPVFGDKNWQNLQQATELRHRITHPNKSHDLHISEAEWNTAYEGITWLLRELFSFFNQVHTKYGHDA